jgi:hypothetical protein
MAVPQEAGFYWAKWLAANKTNTVGSLLAPGENWDVVYVFESKSGNETSNERFRVRVVGVEGSQEVQNFTWGPGPLITPTFSVAGAGDSSP